MDQTYNRIRAEGAHVQTLPFDLARDDEVHEMADRLLGALGRVDVLVNNAARLPRKRFGEMTMEDWDRTLAVNLRAPVLLCKLFLPGMKK